MLLSSAGIISAGVTGLNPSWEPSMGSSHRLPNRYPGNAYANRYPSNSPINKISMVTNNHKNSCIVPNGVYTWVRHKTSTEIYGKTLQAFDQCSSRVRAARSVSRNVTSDRSRSAKTSVGTSQINSLASSGFTEQHASSSEVQWTATLPAVFQATTPSADFNYKSPGHLNQPPTSNIKKLRLKLRIMRVVYLQIVSIKVHTRTPARQGLEPNRYEDHVSAELPVVLKAQAAE
jgi:hypothetical protein